MVQSIQTCTLLGLEVHPIVCEVDLAAQLPSFSLVGLPSSLTQESRERIRAAVVNSGLEWPARKVTINLLPANFPKWGCQFELPMALGVLAAAAPEPPRADIVALGELSLSGQVRPCGWLPAAADWLAAAAHAHLARHGEPLVLIAHEHDVRQLCAAAPGLPQLCEVRDVRRLSDAAAFLLELARRPRGAPRAPERDFAREWLERIGSAGQPAGLDTLAAVENEPLATVAALVAATGRHHCLFAGPHGAGKSMLVRAICEALPRLSETQQLERSALLRSFGDAFAVGGAANHPGAPPIVRLQTSISRAALEGALLESGQVLPGELTRAHLGVLVADEFLEYRRDVLEAFRQPLDEGLVRLQRAKFRTALPSRFQLLATTNLCPCGGYGRAGACRCPRSRWEKYQAKLSGPLLDRFDLVVLVGEGKKTAKLRGGDPTDVTRLVRELCRKDLWKERIEAATGNRVNDASRPDNETDPAELWGQVSCEATGRGRMRIARVSRTLAALLGEPRNASHLRLAIALRDELLRKIQPQAPEFNIDYSMLKIN